MVFSMFSSYRLRSALTLVLCALSSSAFAVEGGFIQCPRYGEVYSDMQEWDPNISGTKPMVCAPPTSSTPPCLIFPTESVCTEFPNNPGQSSCSSPFAYTGDECANPGQVIPGGDFPNDPDAVTCDESNGECQLLDELVDEVKQLSTKSDDLTNTYILQGELASLLDVANGIGTKSSHSLDELIEIDDKLADLSTSSDDANNVDLIAQTIEETGRLNRNSDSIDTSRLLEPLNDIHDESLTTNNHLSNIESKLDSLGSDSGSGSSNSITADSCSQTFQCDGDEIACFIAQQDYDQRCQIEDDFLEGGLASEVFESLEDDFIGSPEADIDNFDAGTIDVTSYMTRYVDSDGFDTGVTSDECPASDTVEFTIAGQPISFDVDYLAFCDLAKIIRWFVVAFSMICSALMIAKFM